MNRRGFFALVGAVCATSKAIDLVPVFEAWRVPSLTAEPLHIVGLNGWLPNADDYTVRPLIPRSLVGRMEWIASAIQEGWITSDDAMKLIEVA